MGWHAGHRYEVSASGLVASFAWVSCLGRQPLPQCRNERGQFLDIDCSCRFLYASVDFPVAAIGVDGSISEGRSKVRDGATFFVLSNSR